VSTAVKQRHSAFGQSLWLTQKQLAELFQTTVPNINIHIKNIIDEGELEADRTIQDFLIVQKEGIRNAGN